MTSDLAAIRERHRYVEGHNADGDEREGCICGELWVCDTADALAHIDALTAKVEGLNDKARENYNEQTSGIDFFDGEFAAYSTVLAILRGEA